MKRFECTIDLMVSRLLYLKGLLKCAEQSNAYEYLGTPNRWRNEIIDIEDAIKNLEEIREMGEIKMKLDDIDKKIEEGVF